MSLDYDLNGIREYTAIDTIVDDKITTMGQLLSKIKKYQNLKEKYRKEDYDIRVKMKKNQNGIVGIRFSLMMYDDAEIEIFPIDDLLIDDEFLSSLYQGLKEQADCRELTLINGSKKGIKFFNFQISQFVLFKFDKSFYQDNSRYDEFFDDLYRNATEEWITRLGEPMDENLEISDGLGQKVYK